MLLLGYNINIQNNQNKILFSDILKSQPNENSFRNLSAKQTGLQLSYDCEVIPKIPIIKEVDLQSSDNSQLTFILYRSDVSRTSIIECQLGTW